MRGVQAVAIAALWAASCTPDIPSVTPPTVVRALWNPATSTLPTPTNLARNESAGQLDLPLSIDQTPAEYEFRLYLNSLDGYPLSSTLVVPTSAPLSEAGLAGAFVVVDVETGESIDVDATVDGGRVTAAPTLPDEPGSTGGGWQAGHTYAFGLRGYAGGARGGGGELVVADAPFYLIRTEEDLRDHPYAMPGHGRAEKADVADRLEELRQRMFPLYESMAVRGVPRDEIAVAASFTTTGRPSFWFDAARRIVPIPNGLLINQSTGLVELPVNDSDDHTTVEIKSAISEYDGAATSATLSFRATADFDATTITAPNVRLLQIHDGGISDVALEYGVRNDATTAFVRPTTPLRPGTHHVLVATRAVTSGGIPLESQPISALLRLKASLTVDGESQVGSLDNATAERLEVWRSSAQPALDWLEANGTARFDLSLVVPFRTLTTTERMLALRAKLYRDNVATEIADVTVATPLQRGLPLMFNVHTIATGQFTIDDFIDPISRSKTESPHTTAVDFVLTIPDSATPGTPVPVVLFGHGLVTSRELLYLIADQLAAAGFAAFSFDFPYHGRRSICLQNTDCAGNGTCNASGECSTTLAMVASPFPNGPELPATTGTAFIEIDNIVGTRDHFQQAVLDAFQAIRVIRSANWPAQTGGYVLNPNDIVYLGMSLGGIVGSVLAGTEPTIRDFVLNVPGGDFFTTFRDSPAFMTAFNEVLNDRMAPPGTDAYDQLEASLRWVFDAIDPINIAPDAMRSYPYTDPITGAESMSPVKRVLLQMSVGDSVIPNSSTRALASAFGLPISSYDVISNHAFLFDLFSIESQRAWTEIIAFLEAR